MNEPLLCWICVVAIAVWRVVMLNKRFRERVERLMHLGGDAFLLEWYFLAMTVLSLWLARAMYDVVLYDYIVDRAFFIEPAVLQEKVPRELVSGDLAFPVPLRRLAALAPLVGFASFLWNSYHIYTFVQRQKNAALDEVKCKREGDCPLELGCMVVDVSGRVGKVGTICDDPNDAFPVKVHYEDGGSDWVARDGLSMYVEESNPWHLDPSADMTLLVIMMPAVFVVMAMRSEIRVLQIFLGSSFKEGEIWGEYALWRKCTYTMDLECAAAFQYLTVVAFALLCAQFFGVEDLTESVERREKHLIIQSNKLRHRLHQEGEPVDSSLSKDLEAANAEHQFSLTWAGLQGLWSYVIVGVFRCMFSITMAGLVELHSDYQDLLVNLLDKYQPVFVFAAMLCIYNWTIIQRLQDIKRKEALGPNATLKFIAVRGLLLVGDGQKLALHGSLGKQWLHLSDPQADLVHSILLLFECLLVVAWNVQMWSGRVMGRKELRRGDRTGVLARSVGEPLLSA